MDIYFISYHIVECSNAFYLIKSITFFCIIIFRFINIETTSKEDHFKKVGKKWGELSVAEKLKFKEDASSIRKTELKGMKPEDAIAQHFKTIENSVILIC